MICYNWLPVATLLFSVIFTEKYEKWAVAHFRELYFTFLTIFKNLKILKMGQKYALEAPIFGHFGRKMDQNDPFWSKNDRFLSFCLADGQGYFWSFLENSTFASAHKIQKWSKKSIFRSFRKIDFLIIFEFCVPIQRPIFPKMPENGLVQNDQKYTKIYSF